MHKPKHQPVTIDKSQLSLRAVQTDDKSFLYQLFSQVKTTELGAEHWDETQLEPLLRMQFNAQQQHYRTWQGSSDDQIVVFNSQDVGRLIIQRTVIEIIIADLTLLSEFQNQGIGTSLIQALQKNSQQLGLPLRLHVFKMSPALTLYQRLGFEMISTDDTQDYMEWCA